MKKIPRHIISALIISLAVVALVVYLGLVFSPSGRRSPSIQVLESHPSICFLSGALN